MYPYGFEANETREGEMEKQPRKGRKYLDDRPIHAGRGEFDTYNRFPDKHYLEGRD